MSDAEWSPLGSAPRDGSWVLLEGEFDGGDTSSTRVGRFEPRAFDIGDQSLTYEWRVFVGEHLGLVEAETAQPKWNWYCEGRVSGWLPLPV